VKKIETYRQVFRLMFHEPLDLSALDFPTAVHTLHRLLQLAGAYDSLALLRMPIALVLRPLQSHLAQACSDHYFELLPLALAAQSTWLFREVVCRLVGDQNYTDKNIKERLVDSYPNIVSLVLKKRNKLREMMDGVENSILTLRSPNNSCYSAGKLPIAMGTAGFRHEISRHFRSRRSDTWRIYAIKFRALQDSQILPIPRNSYYSERSDLWFNRVHAKFGEPYDVSRYDFEKVLRSLQSRTVALIAPLFKCVVQEPTPKTTQKEIHQQGFLCLDISEHEMPWNISTVEADETFEV